MSTWVKWKDGGGPRVLGKCKYSPSQPWGPWTKIMGVVARCEGNHDTVVMYDETGVTWGFLQWTFTSGRLQSLLESFKSVQLAGGSLWELSGISGSLKKFGIGITGGNFVDLTSNRVLYPEKHKKEIVAVCMKSKSAALALADTFAALGANPDVQAALVAFGKAEWNRALDVVRAPLKDYKTIRALLKDDWNSMAPALFFNLWQNSPGGAYTLFMKARKESDQQNTDLFEVAWRRSCLTPYANWGYGDGDPHPRVERIKPAVKEFYGVDLKLVRP